MSNPFFSNKNILYYLSVWALISCVHFLILYLVFNFQIRESLSDSLIFNGLYTALGLGLWFTVKYINVEKKSLFSLFLNHLSASIIIIFVWLFLSYALLNLILSNGLYLDFLSASLPWRFLIGLFYYINITLIYYVIIFYTQYQEKKIKEAELIIKTQESELKRLRAQINPHFIFNTLNSISSLTLFSPEKAQEMVVKLSDFLRYSLKHDSQKKVTFKEELENVKLYLDIEKIRFGERFIYSEEIDNNCIKARLPEMILQPLFENALKHGVYESLDSVAIELSCTCDAQFLYVRLKNSFSDEEKMKKGTGTGISNIQNQLRLTYGRNDLFRIVKNDGSFEVFLTFPQFQPKD